MNSTLSPRPGRLWRIVRRVAAWLRWRALWRRGMSYDRAAAWRGAVASVSMLHATIGDEELGRLYDRAMLESDWRVAGCDIYAAVEKHESEYFSKSSFPLPKKRDD